MQSTLTPEQKLAKVNSFSSESYEFGDVCLCMACQGRFAVQACGVDDVSDLSAPEMAALMRQAGDFYQDETNRE
jgi:hypothetical protein